MKNKGITLVALVVTIIILLILAGVAITSLTNTDLFKNAKQAKTAIENAQNNEDEILNKYNGKIIEQIDGTREINTIKELNIKEKENVIYRKNTFKIARIINNTVKMICIPDENTPTKNLSGFDGVNNCQKYLTEVCRENFSNESIGIKSIDIYNATLLEKNDDILEEGKVDYWLATSNVWYDSPYNNCHYFVYTSKGKFDLRNGYAKVDYNATYAVCPIITFDANILKRDSQNKLYIQE